MNFQNMDYFLAVAKTLNISRAAKSLNITQQALSGQIARLEEELGIPLFTRSPRLALTYAGEMFRRQAEKFNDLRREYENIFLDLRKSERGQLRIGTSYSRGQAILPYLLPDFSKEHPLAELSVLEDRFFDIQTQLLAGNIDLILTFLPFGTPEIHAEPLFQERLIAVVPKQAFRETFGKNASQVLREFKKTNDFSLLGSFPLLLLNKGEYIRGRIDRGFTQIHYRPNVKFESSNSLTVVELASRGMGITIAHELMKRGVAFDLVMTDISEEAAALINTNIKLNGAEKVVSAVCAAC